MIKTTSALKKEFVNYSYLAIHKAPILILSDIDDSISWELIRYQKKKSFPPGEAAENKMRDRSVPIGVTGNANSSQIIPVSSGDQVQIRCFSKTRSVRSSHYSTRILHAFFLVRIKSGTSGIWMSVKNLWARGSNLATQHILQMWVNSSQISMPLSSISE